TTAWCLDLMTVPARRLFVIANCFGFVITKCLLPINIGKITFPLTGVRVEYQGERFFISPVLYINAPSLFFCFSAQPIYARVPAPFNLALGSLDTNSSPSQ